MQRTSILCLAITLACRAAFAGAEPETTIEFSPVVVNNMQWLQPVHFSKFTWEEVEQVCSTSSNGRCDGNLGQYDLSGWTWAEAGDVAALFNVVVGTDALNLTGLDRGQQFTQRDRSWGSAFFALGFTAEEVSGRDLALKAYVRSDVSREGYPPYKLYGGVSAFYRPYCAAVCSVAEIGASLDFHSHDGPPKWGYWFYRPVQSAVVKAVR